MLGCNQIVQHCLFTILLISALLNKNKDLMGQTMVLNQNVEQFDGILREVSVGRGTLNTDPGLFP